MELDTAQRQAIARDLWDRAITIAESLGPDDWSRPTPCPDWDVHDLIAHLSAIQTMFDGGPSHDPPEGWAPPADLPPRDAWTAMGVAARKDWEPKQLIDELRLARDGQIERLGTREPDAATDGPIGPTTEAGLFQTRCYDVWVHLQDLAIALGRDAEVHDESPVVGLAAETMAPAVPFLLGKRVGAEEGARLRVVLGAPVELDRVATVAEGRGRWDEEADADSVPDVVRATPGAFTLLVSGRGDAETWRAAGALSWDGALAEAFVDRARVF